MRSENKPLNESFKKKIESVQYNAALIITGAIKGTCRDKIYQELGLEYLADRRWSRKIIFFHKIILGLQPSYLQNYLTPYDNERPYLTRYVTQKSIKTFRGRNKAFESFSFPYCAKELGNLSDELRNIDSIKTFKLSTLNFVRPRENSVFAVHEINGLMCSCGKEPETTLHYFLRCDFYSIHRLELLNDICALRIS